MNCRSAEYLFSPFLEEELSQRERRSLESHLEGCRRCSTAVEELRATVALMAELPSFETSPDFEEAVMDRIRSGEALRPTLVEWLSEWLSPARLRPVFLAGAAGCAVWVAFLLVNPIVRQAPTLASRPGSAATAPDTRTARSSETAAPSAIPAGSDVIASAPSVAPSAPPSAMAGTGPAPVRSDRRAPDAVASRVSPAADSAAGNGSYQDEYILDQFYLNRSSEDGVHSIVPVTGRPSDDVYIIF
jgi:putative zinc finger protein